MEPVKIALCLAILIVLSNSRYTEEWKSKTLSDPSENRDEDSPSTLDVQSAAWLTMAEKFLTNRGTLIERTSHVVSRSRNPCVKNATKVVYNGNNLYTEVECKNQSMMCTRNLHHKCVPVYSYITALRRLVKTDCECPA